MNDKESRMFAEVKISGKQKIQKISITSRIKPAISDEMIINWQELADLLADTFNVTAGLIMHVIPEKLEVFLGSRNTDNPFLENDQLDLGTGLFCETVMGKNELLHVYDLHSQRKWRHLANSRGNITSYLGLPVRWPDGELFGTICVMDNKPNNFSSIHTKLLNHYREYLQQDLKSLMITEENEFLKEQMENLLYDLYSISEKAPEITDKILEYFNKEKSQRTSKS
jgi:c-di-GMP phosphodiesterase